ncbi:DUF1212-domain-containing protein [Aaosphaeria arxii CBS 175.79]|uniref:DUF1212-domain-containing protein n=1 Tax=Aaosphaeria arxii CBS 175.79 TaxID=1450172 RepID=A0A6A5XLC2_9PLEO|nr:DUF1212-domain-containing protein [Aaosphaeria arxii CBS 175.79]KAF2013942.1 DUF1212-domain-containing protein [Aaosphaeria arxii CBS 175.79]
MTHSTEPIDPGPSSHELEDWPPQFETDAQNTATNTPDYQRSATPVSPERHGRPRVRFDSRAAAAPPPTSTERPAAAAPEQQRSPPGLKKPRPVLSRNPNSSSSVVSEAFSDESMSAEKAKSAADAARRAQAMAIEAWNESTTTHAQSQDATRRWSSGSEAFTDPDFAERGYTSDYTRLQDLEAGQQREGEPQGGFNAEAANLLRAHTQILHNKSTAAEDGYTASGNPRGGVFYHILQAYRTPAYDPTQSYKVETPETPGTPRTPGTPQGGRRKKWYDQPEKDAQSQETLARLIGASTKLANPNDSKPAPTGTPEMRKRKHKRNSSGRFMSMVGLSQEHEAKITVHVADILQRQKYLIKMCKALMLFGAPTHRLEEYLTMAAKVLEIDSQFLYIPGCMIISFGDVLTHTTEVKIVRTVQGVNLGKLKDIHQIYKEVLHDVISLEESLTRLDTIINAKDSYPTWLCVLMYGLASTAVSVFFKARFIDMPVIFCLGTLLGVLQLYIAPLSKTYSTVFEVSAAILITFISRALASLRGGNLFCFSALTQSGIAMILPGWLVLSSSLELQSKAIVPGSIRMVFAIIYSLFLGYGITVGTALYGAIDKNATMQTECAAPLSPYWNFLFVPLYIFFVTFTVQAKLKQMPVMILIATAGYTVNFFSSKRFSASAPIAYTFGAFAVGVLANLYSRLRHGVAAAVLLPAVYVQVPGSLASSGAITSGLQTATLLTDPSGTVSTLNKVNIHHTKANTMIRSIRPSSMIQIAIGITVGLFMSALVVYPMGKRRSGLWTL